MNGVESVEQETETKICCERVGRMNSCVSV